MDIINTEGNIAGYRREGAKEEFEEQTDKEFEEETDKVLQWLRAEWKSIISILR